MSLYKSACRGSLAAKAQAWKACGASPHEGSIPSLGVMLFEEEGIKDINKDVNINIDNFKTFLIVQKNLSDATVKNHIRYFVIFLQYLNKRRIENEDIQNSIKPRLFQFPELRRL